MRLMCATNSQQPISTGNSGVTCRCKIDWAASGVDLCFLEQSIVTRNDFIHNVDLLSAYVYPSAMHNKKHPASAFRDPAWGPDIPRTTVTDPTLRATVDNVLALKKHIEKSMT